MRSSFLRITLLRVAIVFLSVILLGSATRANASSYSFQATAADYCGLGGIYFSGGGGFNANGSPNLYWTIHISPDLLQSYSGSSFQYSWQLKDQQGLLAWGDYNSTNGSSHIYGVTSGATDQSGEWFYASRAVVGPVSNMSYEATGSFYMPVTQYGSCGQSFDATTFTTSGGGGYFKFNP